MHEAGIPCPPGLTVGIGVCRGRLGELGETTLKRDLQEVGVSRILEVVRRYWGFDSLRPLQDEAIQAGLEGRDSLVVMPTGGGKSLCYQVPPLLSGRTDVVVSPLISLMHDQVAGLVGNGYPAAALHSNLSRSAQRRTLEQLRAGDCRLLFLSPERLLSPGFTTTLKGCGIGSFAIDEAHCISHWGHDFRPEYRRLSMLKKRFPEASVQAFTATATRRVRDDIVAQLGLREPRILVGDFDRPNLIYRVVPRLDLRSQVGEVLARHKRQAVIVYCITRADTERLASHLQETGYRALAYHAGMTAEERRTAQEAFSRDRIDIIVATVAFGMGIDRSDVRCVIHAAMPKSIEHYQQESGRAGRDGLEAECILFYSPADVLRWESLMQKSSSEADPAVVTATLGMLGEMRRFCAPGGCRHRKLVQYFGQDYGPEDCQACDLCLGEVEDLEDGTVTAQKILSCVARSGERFGVGHTADILLGAKNERVRTLGHDRLSTYGLLESSTRKQIINLIYQLIDQEVLARSDGEYPVLKLNPASWMVMRGERQVWLMPIKGRRVREARFERESWDGVDRTLFDELRKLRLRLAGKRNVPPYLIFSDASLRDMARRRPTTPEEFLRVHGVAERKLADLGEIFLRRIDDYSQQSG